MPITAAVIGDLRVLAVLAAHDMAAPGMNLRPGVGSSPRQAWAGHSELPLSGPCSNVRYPPSISDIHGLRVGTAQAMRFNEIAERQTKADKTGDSSQRPAAPAATFPPTRI